MNSIAWIFLPHIVVLLALFLAIIICAALGIEPTDDVFKRKGRKK